MPAIRQARTVPTGSRQSQPQRTIGGRSTGLLFLIGLLVACNGGEDPERQADGASRAGDAVVTDSERVPAEPRAAVPSNPVPIEPVSSPSGEETQRNPERLSRNPNDLIGALEELDWGEQNQLTEAAERLLRQLRAEGANALVPIRDWLLERDEGDAAPDELRLALLDVLLSLRLPEVEDVVLELLASAPSGAEVWRLGHYLESTQPGRYSDLIRSAAELSVVSSEPGSVLPPELFDLLGVLGNEHTADLLAQVPQSQEVYASLALADLADGSGLPVLEQRAGAFRHGRDTVQGRLALQLLAQEAPRYPGAATVLIDLAEQGLIPRDLWPYVLDIVAGNWALSLFEPPAELLIGSHTYYHPGGNQVIYRAAPDPYGGDDGLDSQRLYLLDRLRPLAPPDLVWGEEG